MPSARPRESSNPYRVLALAVIAQALTDHHWRWFFGEWEPICFRPEGPGTIALWCEMAEIDPSALGRRVRFLCEEWLWDLAARAIRKDMEGRA